MRFLSKILAITLFWAAAACQNTPEQIGTGNKTPAGTEGEIIPNEYILKFDAAYIAPAISHLKPEILKNREQKAEAMKKLCAQVEAQIDEWLLQNNIDKSKVLARYTSIVAGVALKIDKATFERLQKSEAIESIEYNRVERLPNNELESIETSGSVHDRAQTTPCAITNAGGSVQAGNNRWIWIVDTGIDLDHEDLYVISNAPYAAVFIASAPTPDDDYWHGTHVAGIAAAKNNGIGTVGVAAGAPVVPVKVLDNTGVGTSGSIFMGLDHIGIYGSVGDVVNMSLGGLYGTGCSTNTPFVAYLNGLASAGMRIAIAAGNSADNAALYAPACVNGPGIFTIANMTCLKTFWTGIPEPSNYGRPPVDWIATGVSVYSTMPGNTYGRATGSSASAPVVAGIMQLRNAAPVNGGSVTYNGVSYKIAKRN